MQNKLEWRHAYQDRLEKLYALNGEASQTASVCTAQYGDSQPNSRLAIDTTERCKQCWTALTNLSSSSSSRYHSQPCCVSNSCSLAQVLSMCICFRQIAAELTWLRWAKLAVSRLSRQHRGILLSMRGACEKLHMKLTALKHCHIQLQWLQDL